MIILAHNNYSFREVEDSDHEWLVELHNDPAVLYNITNPSPITLDEHLNWWNSLNKEKEKRFIFCVDGERVGFVKFYTIDKINKNCLLGADIHKAHRGKGYAKIMWKMMLVYSFDTLELHRVSLTAAEYNRVALKVYFGVGFMSEGVMIDSLYRDGSYYNQICMSLTEKEWRSFTE